MTDAFTSPVPLPDDLATALDRLRAERGSCPPVLYFQSVASTNDLATRLADRGAVHLTTVMAELQTAGRGRLGRSWYSPPGAGLYASVVVRGGSSTEGASRDPSAAQEPLSPLISITAGVALAEAVRAATRLPVDIKWPNDLVVGRRKLAGILTEASAGGRLEYAIVGFGINLRPAAYPPEIADRATSIEAELGRPVDRGLLFAWCLGSMMEWTATLLLGKTDVVLDRWRSLAPSSRGSHVEWTGPSGSARGITDGIDQDGALLVRTNDRVERIIAGEVKWL